MNITWPCPKCQHHTMTHQLQMFDGMCMDCWYRELRQVDEDRKAKVVVIIRKIT